MVKWNTVEHQGSWHWYNDKRLRLQSRINTLKKLNRRYDSFKMIQVKLRQLKLETSLVWKMAQSTSRTLTRPWRKYASPPAGVTHLNGHLSRVDSVPRWNLNLEPGFSDFQMLLTLTTLWCINYHETYTQLNRLQKCSIQIFLSVFFDCCCFMIVLSTAFGKECESFVFFKIFSFFLMPFWSIVWLKQTEKENSQ